jgi:hypothetical protein
MNVECVFIHYHLHQPGTCQMWDITSLSYSFVGWGDYFTSGTDISNAASRLLELVLVLVLSHKTTCFWYSLIN